MLLKKGPFDITSETERLVIRPLEVKDYLQWLDGFHQKLPKQNKYDDEKKDMGNWSQEKFNDVIHKHQELALRDEAYVFGIFLKEGKKHIGKVEFSTILRDEFQWGMLGYRLHNQFWKNGYAKEAVKASLNIAFNNLNFHRVEAHINVDNKASILLAERVGMKFECKREKFIYEGGKWTDHLIYYMNS